MVMTLYNGGAHLDFRSRDTLTPMHKAATIGNDKALKTLLELGAFAEVRDGRHLTPLYYSILSGGSVQAIEYLLFNGSTIGVRDDNNWQEIHHACKLGLSQHLDHLIYYGADVNAKNNSGNTPLHVCAIHNKENCARILLFRGCNRQERNLANQSAFESAIIAGNQLVADLIQSHRDADTVPIRDRPFYNTKRRSIYASADSHSTYSLSLNGTNINASVNGSIYSHGNLSSQQKDKKSTLTMSMGTTDTLLDWTSENPTSAHALSASLRSKSMPKLVEDSAATGYMLNPIGQSATPAAAAAQISEGSSSPTSRSRSISSDDHGFGSASLSNMSNSPNNYHHNHNHHQIESYGHRKRLYPTIPNRTYICHKAFKAGQVGELELKKGDLVEVFSVGDSGYWEGRCLSTGCEGWFKASSVQEFDNSGGEVEEVLKRQRLLDLIQHCDLSALRTVVLQRGRKGFGFVLRGAKTNDLRFEPTPEVPALQFLESVDKDSNADKAGLKPLDFVLEINNVDVTCRTHAECVKLIKKTGDTLALKVYTATMGSATGMGFLANAANLASSNLASNLIYQAPGTLASCHGKRGLAASHANLSLSSTTTAASHYACTNAGPMSTNHTVNDIASLQHQQQAKYASVMDGTKSLPHKKKRKFF